MILQEQLQSVYADCGHAPDPGPAVQARIRRFLNEAVRVVLTEPDMDRLLDSDQPYTFTSVAAQARYGIPDITAIRHISEQTNDWVLRARPLDEYRRLDPDPAQHPGTPTDYVPIGRVAVAGEPSTASELFIQSTSASDVGMAFLEGTITGGYTRAVSVRMTGVTAVSLSALITSWIDVSDLYLSTTAVGTVTLTQTSGVGTELARITIGQTRQKYLGFYLWPTPVAAVVYTVDYRRPFVDMVQSTDEPPFASEFHALCPAYARMREWEARGEADQLTAATAQWARWLGRLKYAIRSDPDFLPVAGRNARTGHSRLGAWTPADYYTR